VRKADCRVITGLIIEFIAPKNNRHTYSSILVTQGVCEEPAEGNRPCLHQTGLFEGRTRLYNKKVYKSHSLRNIKTVKFKRMKRARHVTRPEEIKTHTQHYSENVKEREHLRELVIDDGQLLK
jgi:hypothetical protein